MGITLAPEKSGKVLDKFKFLGVEWNLTRQEVSYRGEVKSWRGKNIKDPRLHREMMEWFQKVAQWYGKPNRGWYWEVANHSIAKDHYSVLSLRQTIKTVIYSWWTGKALDGHRYFIGCGIYNVMKLSTISTADIIDRLGTLNLRKVKPLDLVEGGKFEHWQIRKNNYFEEIYENSLRAFTRQILPDWPNVHETLSALDD
jgi:hypothetical protein